MLELNDVHTYYGESYVLQGVSLKVIKGSVVALLGRNGMGKTTTIRSIMGFNRARRGTIHFIGKDITHLRSEQISRLGIGIVPQGRCIFSSLSVEENLTMAARLRGKKEAWALNKIYSMFPALEDRKKNRGNMLSGGEQSMLSIGRSLMTNPDLILMDEPSEGLAPIMIRQITRTLNRLKESGLSILLVEQNLPLALRVADHVYVLSKGKIVYESESDEFKENEEIKARYIGVA